MAEQQSAFFTYKGKPLVRKGDTIYYGSMGDDYVVMLNVQSHTKEGDLDLADNVTAVSYTHLGANFGETRQTTSPNTSERSALSTLTQTICLSSTPSSAAFSGVR